MKYVLFLVSVFVLFVYAVPDVWGTGICSCVTPGGSTERTTAQSECTNNPNAACTWRGTVPVDLGPEGTCTCVTRTGQTVVHTAVQSSCRNNPNAACTWQETAPIDLGPEGTCSCTLYNGTTQRSVVPESECTTTQFRGCTWSKIESIPPSEPPPSRPIEEYQGIAFKIPSTTQIRPTGTLSIPQLIGQGLRLFTGVFGSIALVMVIYGGLQIMLARGQSDKVKGGINVILWASIGLVTMLLAYALVEFVFRAVA